MIVGWRKCCGLKVEPRKFRGIAIFVAAKMKIIVWAKSVNYVPGPCAVQPPGPTLSNRRETWSRPGAGCVQLPLSNLVGRVSVRPHPSNANQYRGDIRKIDCATPIHGGILAMEIMVP